MSWNVLNNDLFEWKLSCPSVRLNKVMRTNALEGFFKPPSIQLFQCWVFCLWVCFTTYSIMSSELANCISLVWLQVLFILFCLVFNTDSKAWNTNDLVFLDRLKVYHIPQQQLWTELKELSVCVYWYESKINLYLSSIFAFLEFTFRTKPWLEKSIQNTKVYYF